MAEPSPMEPSSIVIPTAPYSFRPPSPPYIHIPSSLMMGQRPISLLPTFDDVDAGDLTAAEIEMVTGGRDNTQQAVDRSTDWRYESRREAQAVLDFVYLGPTSVARDHDWLRRSGTTMVLVARDARLAERRLLSVDKAAREVGIAAEYVDVDGQLGLIRAFPQVVKTVNRHLVQVYRSQGVVVDGDDGGSGAAAAGDGHNGQEAATSNGHHRRASRRMIVDPAQKLRRGKVLVVCETGNDRSAAVVAAYIMAVFGTPMIRAVQFVSVQRFCANFDEETKRILQSWEDILRARRAVSQARRSDEAAAAAAATSHAVAAGGAQPTYQLPPVRARKRQIETAYGEDREMDEDGDGADGFAGESGYANFALDRERYTGRANFVPFVDLPAPVELARPRGDTSMAEGD